MAPSVTIARKKAWSARWLGDGARHHSNGGAVPRLGETAAFIRPSAAPRQEFRNLQADPQNWRRLGLQGKSTAVGWLLVVGALRVFPLPANALAIRFAQNIQHSNDPGAIRLGPSKTACRASGPDQHQSVKAGAGRATASRLAALTDWRWPGEGSASSHGSG
jgi:hypothetical protein